MMPFRRFTLMVILSAMSLLSACSTSHKEVVNDGVSTDARSRAAIRMQLASAYLGANQAETALEEIRQALLIDPTTPDAYHLLALSYMKLGENALVDQSFKRALAINPKDGDLQSNYGWFLCSIEKYDEAFPYFESAVNSRSNTGPSKPLSNAGICSLRRNDLVSAEKYLNRALQYDFNNSVAVLGLAQVYYRQNKYDEAWKNVQRINNGSSSSAESLWLGARIARALKDKDQEDFLVLQLRKRFPSSREFGAMERGAWNE